ncbi:hypothetical protein [Parabacteroides sp. Marseille-P3160]|uniref:hypothetical protein n=1 Tax=Parabacteroides sp. Marseille-P3160 TaxID=1917887 RepID=UPI001357AA1D|nr:hypothetical protein [Parabacteroides sp. Marseille-P3160]
MKNIIETIWLVLGGFLHLFGIVILIAWLFNLSLMHLLFIGGAASMLGLMMLNETKR